MRIDFHATGAVFGSDLVYATETLKILLFALTRLDLLYLERHPDAPRLYESGVRYKRDPRGTERWGDYGDVLEHGGGDCEDLSCIRVAELIREGIPASPYIGWRVLPDGRKRYHIVVKRQISAANPTQIIECPATFLGMRGRSV